jgi:diacylglycerol kinase family enzyme
MATPGVLLNARAGRSRRDPQLAGRVGALLGPGRLQVTSSAGEIEPALAALREAGVDTLVLVGGDGTIGGTLTPLFESWPTDRLPAIVPIAGGTVNTIARSLGARGSAEECVARLLQGDPPHRDSRRAVVCVRAEGGAPRYGLIFVNGVGVRFLELYYATGLGVRGATSVLTRLAGSALVRGPLARRIFSPFFAEVRVDGELLEPRRFTVMGAAGVQHIGLGFRPFLSAGDDPERIHFTVTAASALEILAELPRLRLGRPAQDSHLTHFSATRIEIRSEAPEPWSLDADAFAPARRLELRAGPTLRFVCP